MTQQEQKPFPFIKRNEGTKPVGFCGTHGTGKSTILNELSARGYAVDTNSLPRAAQIALGWESLREIEKSEENMWALQDMVLVMLRNRDAKIRESGILTFVDRTPVDFAGYTYVWAERLGWKIDRPRYEQYMLDCATACRNYHLHIYFPMRDEIEFVPQRRRGDKESRETNAHAMCEFINRFGILHSSVRTLDVKERADECISFLDLKDAH